MEDNDYYQYIVPMLLSGVLIICLICVELVGYVLVKENDKVESVKSTPAVKHLIDILD